MISGIVHVLKSGGRWIDAPSVYAPHKTLYNRYSAGMIDVSVAPQLMPGLVHHGVYATVGAYRSAKPGHLCRLATHWAGPRPVYA